MHWLPATAVLLLLLCPFPSQRSDHVVSMCLPKQSLPHAGGKHPAATQPVLWPHNLPNLSQSAFC